MTTTFSRLLLLCLSLVVVGCSASEEDLSRSAGTSAPSTDREAIAEEVEQARREQGKIKLACNEEFAFGKVRIATQCAGDADRDGYADSKEATISFKNTGWRATELVFNGVLEKEDWRRGTLERLVLKPSIHNIKTIVALEPRESLVLEREIGSLDRKFLLDLATEPVEYAMSESQKVIISCKEGDEVISEKVFGVRVGMRCKSKKLVINNKATAGGSDDESEGYRGVIVRPNYPDNSIEYIRKSMRPSGGPSSILLLDNAGQDYEVEVFIP